MNRTTKVAVALIVAAGLSTMVYALPEQRAMAHPRLHLLSPNGSPDAFPFGPNSPDPPLSSSKSDPPAFGPNCVGCIKTQNLANASITNPKLAPGSVSSADIGAGAVATPNIADQAITTPKIAPGAVSINTTVVDGPPATILGSGTISGVEAKCPSGTVVTGGGVSGGPFSDPLGEAIVQESKPLLGSAGQPVGWFATIYNPALNSPVPGVHAVVVCATIHP